MKILLIIIIILMAWLSIYNVKLYIVNKKDVPISNKESRFKKMILFCLIIFILMNIYRIIFLDSFIFILAIISITIIFSFMFFIFLLSRRLENLNKQKGIIILNLFFFVFMYLVTLFVNVFNTSGDDINIYMLGLDGMTIFVLGFIICFLIFLVNMIMTYKILFLIAKSRAETPEQVAVSQQETSEQVVSSDKINTSEQVGSFDIYKK